MSTNKQTVQRYMDAYTRLNHPEILECVTEDVEWYLPGAFHITGKAAFDREIESACFAGAPVIDVTRMTEEGGVVIAEGLVHSTRSEGGTFHAAFCDVFELRDAKIKRLTSYLMEVQEPQA